MKIKIFFAFVILSGCLGRMYATVMEGKALASLSTRDGQGFIIDKIDVPITASQEQKGKYLKLFEEPLTEVEASAQPEPSPGGELELPEENTSTVSLADSESQVSDDSLKSLGEPPLPIKTVVPPIVNSDLQKKLLSLISCKTKDSMSRIPSVVWNRMVKKAGVKEYITPSDQSLPEISIAIFGEPDCWPKLWSQNPEIENPHDIAKNTKILILLDPEARTPASSTMKHSP
jgi:hypothetical protein